MDSGAGKLKDLPDLQTELNLFFKFGEISMDLEKIEKVAKTQMGSSQERKFREPGWIYHHGRRTGKIAIHLADQLNLDVNRDLLYVAGLFHDLGKGKGQHQNAGADLIQLLLLDLLAEAELDEISEIIRAHNQRREPEQLPDSAKLIQDADLIDHVGHIDIWMAFYWSGSQGETVRDHIAFFEGNDCKRFRDYMRTHLNFDLSRELLKERIQLADDFLTKFRHIYYEGI